VTRAHRLLAFAIVAVFATSVFGAAATLGLSSDRLGAGSTVVADCDTGGITVNYTGDPGPVSGLVVSNLAAACNGGRARATVTKADGTSPVSSTAVATVSSGAVTITFPTSVAPENVGRYHVVVVGP
jgi:hypothetical protein